MESRSLLRVRSFHTAYFSRLALVPVRADGQTYRAAQRLRRLSRPERSMPRRWAGSIG
jgi:hypothetical protein